MTSNIGCIHSLAPFDRMYCYQIGNLALNDNDKRPIDRLGFTMDIAHITECIYVPSILETLNVEYGAH